MLISVIIPVYNAEKTLRQCVDSILAQRFSSFEILLIDDGSRDGSAALCDKYGESNTHVRVFHKPNGGVSSARNVGLDNAQGDWICFIDSDDYVTSGFFEGVIDCRQDLLITDFYEDNNGKLYEIVKSDHIIYNEEQNITRYIREQISTNMVLRGPWGKFFRKDLIRSLRFNTEMKLGEDTCFVFDYLKNIRSLCVNPTSSYVIRKGLLPDSVKYKSSVDYAILSLGFVWEAFKRMERKHKVGSRCFYTFLGYYKLMCKHEWKHNLPRWYRNQQVHRIYNYVFGYQLTFINVKYRILRLASLFL